MPIWKKKTNPQQENKSSKKPKPPPGNLSCFIISNLLMFWNRKPGYAWGRGIQPVCCDPGHHLELFLDIHVLGRLVWSWVQTCWRNPFTTWCRREEKVGTAGAIQQDGWVKVSGWQEMTSQTGWAGKWEPTAWASWHSLIFQHKTL